VQVNFKLKNLNQKVYNTCAPYVFSHDMYVHVGLYVSLLAVSEVMGGEMADPFYLRFTVSTQSYSSIINNVCFLNFCLLTTLHK